jgi:hypothetical protein
MDLEGVRDALYKAILENSQEVPYLLETIGALALTQEPVTIAQMADLLDIEVARILDVLKSLRAIIHDPKDCYESHITPRHVSLCEFLLSETRSGSFFADPTLHGRLAFRCIDLVQRSTPTPSCSAWSYTVKYLWDHYQAFARDTSNCEITAYAKPFSTLFFSHAPGSVFDNLYTSVLREAPDIIMDKLYKSVLDKSQEVAHLLEITSALALQQEPVSVAQMADLLDIEVSCVLDVLQSLRAIIHDPIDPNNSPITPRHGSLRDFLLSETRSGSFFADPKLHGRLAFRCIDLALRSNPPPDRPAWSYAREHIWDHCWEFVCGTTSDDEKQGTYEKVLAYIQRSNDTFDEGAHPTCHRSTEPRPQWLGVIDTMEVAMESLSVAEIANLNVVDVHYVLRLLNTLQPAIDISESNHTAATFELGSRKYISKPSSFVDLFACRPTPAFAECHRRLAYRCISLVALRSTSPDPPARAYAEAFAVVHYKRFLESISEPLTSQVMAELDTIVAHLREAFPTEYKAIGIQYFRYKDVFFEDLRSAPLRFHQVCYLPWRRPIHEQLLIKGILGTILCSDGWDPMVKQELLARARIILQSPPSPPNSSPLSFAAGQDSSAVVDAGVPTCSPFDEGVQGEELQIFMHPPSRHEVEAG